MELKSVTLEYYSCKREEDSLIKRLIQIAAFLSGLNKARNIERCASIDAETSSDISELNAN